jgi:hypothetical protein
MTQRYTQVFEVLVGQIAQNARSMSLSAKRSAYSDMPSDDSHSEMLDTTIPRDGCAMRNDTPKMEN